jgi:hypothetical protein
MTRSEVIRWSVGDKVSFDRDNSLVGGVVSVDDPPFTVRVRWEGDDPEPESMWANRLVSVCAPEVYKE